MFGTFIKFLTTNPFLGVMLVFFLSGILGSLIAVTKEKNIALYFLICLVPVFLIFAIYQRPEREKLKCFKQCSLCQEFLHWDAQICSHCSSPIRIT